MEKKPVSDSLAAFVRGLPQIVPEEWCFRCKVCCRFPDTAGVQTPSWARMEAEWSGRGGEIPAWLKKEPESPALFPRLEPCGQAGYRCPAFDPGTSRCTVHRDRPLDCRLYPFVLAKNPGGTQAVLAVDTKCPYIQEHGSDPEVLRYAAGLSSYLEDPLAEEYVRLNPAIVGPFWPEFLSMAALPRLTGNLQGPPLPPHPALAPVTAGDLSAVKRALSLRRRSYSGYTPASLLGWSDLIHLWQARVGEALCLFYEQAGGLFMPLPPLAERLDPGVLVGAWELLSEANRGAGVSRIEGIEEEEAGLFRQAGFSLREQEREYLYRREGLVSLKGEGYKSHRGAVNRFRRSGPHLFRPFEERDLAPCLQLYTRWAIDRQKEAVEPHARPLVRDGLFFHRRLMMSRAELGLTGRVLEVEGVVRGYTFGAPVSGESFCVFLEIADRALPGAAQALFQEFCREAGNYAWINGMSDCGLEGLRQAKESYRPARFVTTWTAELWS